MRKTVLTLLALVLLGFNAWILYPKYQVFHDAELFKLTPEVTLRTDSAEKVIREGLTQNFITASDFSTARATSSAEKYSTFFENMKDIAILRMKLWDANYVVLWSDIPALNGQRFTDNHELGEVYSEGTREVEGKLGQVEKTVDKNESIAEGGYNNYLEIYIPLVDQKVVGVVEVYVAAEDIVAQYRSQFYRSCMILFGGTLFLFGLILFLFYFNKRNNQ